MTADPARIAVLRQAATTKSTAAVARAEAGIRKLTKTNQPITFRAVAAAGHISVDFLYRNNELRARIEHLRGAQTTPTRRTPHPDAAHDASSIVATLTTRLSQLRHELAETRTQLAVAHGELLQLRRHPANNPEQTPPAAGTPLPAPPPHCDPTSAGPKKPKP